MTPAKVLLAGLLAAGALPLQAGTLTGVVRNATTGRPAPGQDVVLLEMAGGMEAVGATKTDAQGRYTLEHPAIGRGPVLLRVPYRGVNFHQNVPPGRPQADLEIFEPTTDPRAVQIASRVVIFQPNGATLLVGEEYAIQNAAQPPVAYFKPEGTFEFTLPEGAELGQVGAWGPSGMPVNQGTIEKGRNRFAIAFAFRPGQNGVRLAYQLPYPANQATFRAASPYATGRVALIVPPTMQLQAPGFTLSGNDQGWNIYAREGVAARTTFDITVSGTAPPLPADSMGAEGQGGSGTAPAISQLPPRLDSLKWPLVAGFAALFSLGLLHLLRKSRLEAAPAAPAADGVAEVQREVGQGLDEIKDALFRLELRRQAGTLSEEEYLRERARAEQTLRDLLQE